MVCLVFEESWLWQKVSHLKCQLQFLHKKNDSCSREIRWKWCYFEQKVLLEVFCLISDKSGVVQHSNLFLLELDWSVRIWTFCAFQFSKTKIYKQLRQVKASEGFKLYSCNSIQKCRSAFHLEFSFNCIFHVEMKDSINSGQNINLEEIVLKCILFVGI